MEDSKIDNLYFSLTATYRNKRGHYLSVKFLDVITVVVTILSHVNHTPICQLLFVSNIKCLSFAGSNPSAKRHTKLYKMASDSSKGGKTSEKIIAEFQSLRNEQRNLANNLHTLESDLKEHT